MSLKYFLFPELIQKQCQDLQLLVHQVGGRSEKVSCWSLLVLSGWIGTNVCSRWWIGVQGRHLLTTWLYIWNQFKRMRKNDNILPNPSSCKITSANNLRGVRCHSSIVFWFGVGRHFSPPLMITSVKSYIPTIVEVDLMVLTCWERWRVGVLVYLEVWVLVVRCVWAGPACDPMMLWY